MGGLMHDLQDSDVGLAPVAQKEGLHSNLSHHEIS